MNELALLTLVTLAVLAVSILAVRCIAYAIDALVELTLD